MNQRIEIPENTNVFIENGCVCFEKRELKKESFDPKNGDFYTASNDDVNKWIYIFKSRSASEINDTNHHALLGRFGGVIINDSLCSYNKKLTPSTPEEKQIILSEIDKAGYIWNSEKLRIDKKRWRAEKNGRYFSLGVDFVSFLTSHNSHIDDDLYKSGNYFQTKEQALEAGELIKELLFHFHENDEVLTKIKELLK